MGKIKIVAGLLIVTGISLFANLALSFNVSSAHQDIREKDKKIITLNKKIQNLENDQIVVESVKTNSLDIAEQVVTSFFKTQFQYNQESYKSRFEKIKKYVAGSVYGQLTSAGEIEVPGIDFENKINDLEIYLTNKKDSEMNGLILLDTTYTVDTVQNPPITQIYHVKVNENNNSYKITELINIGTFSPMKES